MKIYPLDICEIRYSSFFISVMLHVRYVCFMKQARGLSQNSFLQVHDLKEITHDTEEVLLLKDMLN